MLNVGPPRRVAQVRDYGRRTRWLVLIAGLPLVACAGSASTDSTPALIDSKPRARAAAECLEKAGVRALGPLNGRPGPGDDDAPDWEVIAGDAAGAFIAFYDDPTRAAEIEPSIRESAESFEGEVERQGTVTVIWTGSLDTGDRAVVEDCVLDG